MEPSLASVAPSQVNIELKANAAKDSIANDQTSLIVGLTLGLLGLITIVTVLFVYYRYYYQRKSAERVRRGENDDGDDDDSIQNLHSLFGKTKKNSSIRNFMDTTRETLTRNLTVLGIQASSSSRELDIGRDMVLQIDQAYNNNTRVTNDSVVPVTKNPNISYPVAQPRSSDVFF
jgi:hypothetical protein